MDNEPIIVVWKGHRYRVAATALQLNKVLLPDKAKTLIVIHYWPQLQDGVYDLELGTAKTMEHLFTNLDSTVAARFLSAALAEALN